jgi:hypothetical protein
VDTSACEKCLIARLTSLKHRTAFTFFLPRGPAAGGAFGPELPDTGCTGRAACQNFRTFTTKLARKTNKQPFEMPKQRLYLD